MKTDRHADLLAILDAGPISRAELQFMSRQRRQRALLSIDALIDMLDALDPDPDLEDGGDTEPNCGGKYTSASTDECEEVSEDHDEELDESHDGLEPDVDGEPSLGATNYIDQTRWGASDTNDDELVDENGCDMNGSDNGLGDVDGADEQWGAFGVVCV